MKLHLRNYQDKFIELRIDEIDTTITSKDETKQLIENLEEVIFGLKDFVQFTKNTFQYCFYLELLQVHFANEKRLQHISKMYLLQING